MSKEAQNSIVLTEEALEKFEECVAAFAACGFGGDGPPKDTTFAEIESFGHEVGRLVARAIEARLAAQHAAHYQQAAPCPTCGTSCLLQEDPPPAGRELQTIDGLVPIQEPVCHCSVCHRDFFPSADCVED